MPAVVIQLADFIGHAALIVGRVENGDAIRCERDGTALEVVRRRARRENQCRRRSGRRCERETPVVGLLVAERVRAVFRVGGIGEVGHGQRDLLLPGSDARHAVGEAIRSVVTFDEEGRPIPVEADLRLERRERSGHQGAVADRGSEGGRDRGHHGELQQRHAVHAGGHIH